jgi:CheY-like chemotaxis protein
MAKSILIADDSSELVEVLAEIFNSVGYEVSTVIDGQAAIDSIKKNLPDIILLDVNMPQVSGFEVLRFLRRQAGGEQTRAILFTGDSSAKNAPDSRLADKFLSKPIDMHDLLTALREEAIA